MANYEKQEDDPMAMENSKNNNSVDEKVSVGVRFEPTGYRLITTYLNGRHENLHKLLPGNNIREIDDILSCAPPKLFEKYGFKKHESWYFLSKLKRSCFTINRLPTGDGEGYWVWSNLDGTTKILDPNADTNAGDEAVIGHRNDLVFHSSREEPKVTTTTPKAWWAMRMYLSTTPARGQQVDDIEVLCMIHNSSCSWMYDRGSLIRPAPGD